MRRTALLSLGLAACGGLDLSEPWQLDRLRVLGVRTEPAEPQPGEQTTFSSLIYLPEGDSLTAVIWFACLPEDATDFGCSLDPDLLDALDPEEIGPDDIAALYEAGLIGVEPFLPPVWTPPSDALEGLDERAALEGVNAIINVTAVPASATEVVTDADPGDVELAYKRLPISLATTPNHNPDIVALTVDANEVAAGEAWTARRGQTYELEPLLIDDAVEDYTYVNSDGVEETRTEEPYFTWYAEGGEFDQEYTLYPYSTTEWTAPSRAWEGLVVTVMRDRRGGMAWKSVRVVVE